MIEERFQRLLEGEELSDVFENSFESVVAGVIWTPSTGPL